MSGRRRETDKLIRRLRQQGAVCTKTNGGHWKVRTAQGTVFLGASPSDPRARDNARRDLKTIGLVG